MTVFDVLIICLAASCPYTKGYTTQTFTAETADLCEQNIRYMLQLDHQEPDNYRIMCTKREA